MDRYRKHTGNQEGSQEGLGIGFLIDATGSREDTWEQAQGIQAKMFKSAAGLQTIRLRLAYFGGDCLNSPGWMNSPARVAKHMAAVRCRTGLTQIIEGLHSFIQEAPENRAAAIILVGDAFEEDADQAEHAGTMLKKMGIRVFSFIEGNDPTAQSVFQRLAEITGGKFAKFGSDLPLSDLCEGVALLTSGGEKALDRLKNQNVRRLLLSGPSK